jgi:AbiA family abortive infection protein
VKSLFGIKYETWKSVCKMYFDLKQGTQKAYLQLFPFSKLTQSDKINISSEDFFNKYIRYGTFCLFQTAMLRTENYIFKSDGSFRDSSLLSPILYLLLQSIGKEISESYVSKRPREIEVFYAGNYDSMKPTYKQDYDNFFKVINNILEQYQFFIKTDVSGFYPNINLDKLIYKIDSICNFNTLNISQTCLSLYKEILSYCGKGRFPLVENSVASSYLATVVYLDDIDCKLYDFLSNHVLSINDFKMVRYVDDMYIFISIKDGTNENLYNAYNEIRNEYSSLLKDADLALNSNKCCIKPTHEISTELKKSLYDECINGKKCEIGNLFSSNFSKFLNDILEKIKAGCLTVDEYNDLINMHFSSSSIEFTPNEVFNYFIFEADNELKSEAVINLICCLIKNDISFISIDPKRLAIMIMKTGNTDAIKSFLNQLFKRYRAGKWNSYDTTIAITYLIQSKFQHYDLLGILNKECKDLYQYYFNFCRISFSNMWSDENAQIFSLIISDDNISFYLLDIVCKIRNENPLSHASALLVSSVY